MEEGQIRFFILLSSFSIFSPLVSVNEVYFTKEREFSFLEDSLTPNPRYCRLQRLNHISIQSCCH